MHHLSVSRIRIAPLSDRLISLTWGLADEVGAFTMSRAAAAVAAVRAGAAAGRRHPSPSTLLEIDTAHRACLT